MNAREDIIKFCQTSPDASSYYEQTDAHSFLFEDLDYDIFERDDYDEIVDAFDELEAEGFLTRWALFECPLCEAKISMRNSLGAPSGIYNDDCPDCGEPIDDQYHVELRQGFTILEIPYIEARPPEGPRMRNSLLTERIAKAVTE